MHTESQPQRLLILHSKTRLLNKSANCGVEAAKVASRNPIFKMLRRTNPMWL